MQRSARHTLKEELQEIREGFGVFGRAIRSWFARDGSGPESASIGESRKDAAAGEEIVFSGPEQQIELLGEVLHVDKERIERGEIVVHKEVVTEMQLIEVPVRREELVIRRLSANGELCHDDVLGSRKQLRIPLWEERVVVQKQPVVRQLVTVSKRQVSETKDITDAVRHEELRLDKQGDVEVRDTRDDLDRAA